MRTQIAVRLPEELVQLIDSIVASGRARSRASVIERALERELRLEIAARDIAILQDTTSNPELDDLAAWAQRLPVEHLDS